MANMSEEEHKHGRQVPLEELFPHEELVQKLNPEPLAADHEAEVAELRKQLEQYSEIIKKRNQEIEQINAVHSEEMENALKAKELDHQAQFQAEQALLKAVHSESEDILRSEYVAKISTLEDELLAIEKQSKLDVAASRSDLEEMHSRQLLEIEVRHQEEIAAIKTDAERRLHDLEAECTNQLKEKENELKAAHELLESKTKELESCDKEKEELLLRHKSEVSELQFAFSKRLSEVKREMLRTSSAGPSPQPQSPRQALNKSEDDPQDVVPGDSASLVSPSKLQQFRAQFSQQREDALTQQREKSPSRSSPQNKKDSPNTSISLSKMKADYESKLTQQKSKLEAERKTQVDLLVRKHEKDLVKQEQKFRFELDESQATHAADIERINSEHATEISQLRSEHFAELGAIKAQHASELEILTSQYTSQVDTLKTQHNSEVSQHSSEMSGLRAQYATELDTLTSQHTVQVEALHEQHCDEISAFKSQVSTDPEIKLKELRAELVQEHMAKFKEMTEKLQQVHQSELEALKKEKDDLATSNEHHLHLQREELETEHEQELMTITERHRNEMKRIQDGYEAQMRQAEIDHTHRLRGIIAQNETDNGQSQQLEDTVRQELSRVTEDLEAKLHLLQSESNQREAILKEELELAGEEGRKSQEEVSRLTAVLQAKETEVLKRDQAVRDDETRLSSTIQTLQAERDVLQSTVRALYGAVINCLELSSLVHSVLGDQLPPPVSMPPPTHSDRIPPVSEGGVSSQVTPDGSMSGLSERLLSQLGAMQDGSESSHSTGSTSTSPLPYHTSHSLHTPHGLPPTAVPSTSTGSTASFQRFSDWTDMKQTPSVDSGIISQQTSALQSEGSTLIGTPSTVTVASLPVSATPVADSSSVLSIVPLDTSVTAPHTYHDHNTEDLDETLQTFLSVSLMSATESPAGPPVGSHKPLPMISHDSMLQSLTEQPLIDLSVLPLENSALLMDHTQSSLPQLLPADQSNTTLPFHTSTTSQHEQSIESTSHLVEPPIAASAQSGPAISLGASVQSVGSSVLALPDLPIVHSQLRDFHNSVGALVQRYATTVLETGERESASQAFVSQLQSELDSLRQAHRELQARLKEAKNRERERVTEVDHLQEELDENKKAHETKIKTLVLQLESHEERLGNEVTQDTQALLDSFKASEQDLKTKLALCEKELLEKEQLTEKLNVERESLAVKVREMVTQIEDQEIHLTKSNSEALQLKQESQALKQVNRQLREKQEQADLRVCTTEEAITKLKANYEAQLQQKQEELNNLRDVRDHLSTKEEAEEKLLHERENLINRLSVAEHQLATQSEHHRAEEELVEKEQRLLSQLSSQEQLGEILKARLQEVQSSLELTQQECAQLAAIKGQLQHELHQLSQEFQCNEMLLQATLSEKAISEKHFESCQKELEVVKKELKTISNQRDEAFRELEEVKVQVNSSSQLSTDQDSTLSADPGSQQSADDRSHEVEQLTLVREQLENKVAELELELRAKEEQCLTLEQELEEVRRQLTEHAQALELQRDQELSEETNTEEAKRRAAELQNAVNDLTQRLSLETQLKDSLNEEVSALREEIDRSQRSHEQLLSEEESKHEQETEALLTEHAQKLNDLQLSHLEALHCQRDESDARHAGEMAFIKLHHQEQLEEVQTRHKKEVERLLSDQHSLLMSLDGVGGQEEADLGSHPTDTLLLKIAELAPILAREAQEVSALCQATGQHVLPEGAPRSEAGLAQCTSLEELVERLREVVQDIGAAKDANGAEDWRRDLLQAVEALLDHQRGVLAHTLSASVMEEGGDRGEVQQLLQDQLSQHSAIVQQLHSADRESLLAEIRALRATLDTMRQEQRQQNQDLLAQLRAAQPADSAHQLQSALAELSQLQKELSEKNRELAVRARVDQELGVSQLKLAEVESSLAMAQAEANAGRQELKCVRENEATLKTEYSREKASSSQLRDSLARERTLHQELSAQVEHLTGQLIRSDDTRVALDKLQAELTVVNQANNELTGALQSKEDQLTQTTDKLFQNKITFFQGCSFRPHSRFSEYQESLTLQEGDGDVWCDCDVTFPGEDGDKQRSITGDFNGTCYLTILRCDTQS